MDNEISKIVKQNKGRVSIGTIFLNKSAIWDWGGKQRWWIIKSRVTGYNGACGYWIERTWQWNGSDQILMRETLTLNTKESDRLELLPRID